MFVNEVKESSDGKSQDHVPLAEDLDSTKEHLESGTNPPVAVDADLARGPGQIRKRLRLIHSNLGHPSKSVLMRLLKEAKASQGVLAEAEKFECDFCQKRGHANMHAPSAVIRNHDV